MNNKPKILLTSFLTAILLLGFAVPVNMVGNWYQQFMPNIGSKQINDIVFIDSLTGFAVASRNVNPDTSCIMKTTNAGDNWQIILTQTPKKFSRIQFVNSNTGFVCGGTGGGTPQLYKTTNAGASWNLLSSFGCAYWSDMAVIDTNLIWLVDSDGLCGGAYRTTNGGLIWEQKLSLGSDNPDRIYFFNRNIGYVCNTASGTRNIRKTTDGGLNWTLLVTNDYFYHIYFVDSLTGWKFSFQMRKTTDGGLSWISQPFPTGGIVHTLGVPDFVVLNKDTVISPSGYVLYPNNQIRGVLFRTTDGGSNWMFQVPDTGIHLQVYDFIEFTDKLHGWLYQIAPTGIRTTTGGETEWTTGVEQISPEIPKNFKLYQNFPNPFNPATVIMYDIKRHSGDVKLTVYDMTGREVSLLVSQRQDPGTYKVNFSGIGYSSGIYLYSLYVEGKLIGTKRMVLIK